MEYNKGCNDKQCRGNCWLNVAGDFEVWETISKQCNGSIEEQNLINDIFNHKKPKENIFNLYNFDENEKKIVEGYWWC